jgi:hypothetical protein
MAIWSSTFDALDVAERQDYLLALLLAPGHASDGHSALIHQHLVGVGFVADLADLSLEGFRLQFDLFARAAQEIKESHSVLL